MLERLNGVKTYLLNIVFSVCAIYFAWQHKQPEWLIVIVKALADMAHRSGVQKSQDVAQEVLDMIKQPPAK